MSLESLITTVESGADVELRIEALLAGLAERIKATSNDQNSQRLARELKAAVPALVRAVAARAPA